MKFFPTVSLAVALAAGGTAAGMAQTAATPGSAPNVPEAAAPNTGTAFGQAQPRAAQPQARTPQAQAMPQAQTPQTQGGYAQTEPNAGQTPPFRQPSQNGQAANAAAMPASGASAQVEQVQQKLSAAGLYNGPVDGIMDPDTRAALAKFQEQNGLPRSENLDSRTLSMLMNAQPSQSGTSAPQATQGAAPAQPNANQNGAALPLGAGGNAGGYMNTH